MQFPPFDTYEMADDDILLLKKTCRALSTNFETEYTNLNQHKDLKRSMKAVQDNVAGIALIKKQSTSCILIFTKLIYPKSRTFAPNPGLAQNSLQVHAVAQLRKNFGTIHIRRKTFIDKILDIFLSIAVNFKKHKLFNKSFYVISDDKDKALITIDSLVIDLLLSIRKQNFIVNIVNNKLTVEYPSELDPEIVVKLADFACSMTLV